ncbi:hypothetical protein LOT_1390 [Lentilactobacillus otakiensis DSM 19908 = JCM 15040]|uniref:Uncharacterized protein n=1 Tax=Lentilactobacillus otakiensis DSM 19908 = JCM 15040 TaxID=1423780 RepID=S4NI14_9LACO|nr:hypothetical protein LOT_1390 [Lentilactobacillus otakiensis DSM 19908 = JCM 15040]
MPPIRMRKNGKGINVICRANMLATTTAAKMMVNSNTMFI